ncbi:MAG: hypothetical protein HC844_11770 [Tabrizicola sp.]|nr:hypothetical protein [Tabrizicola sp.]
MTGDAPAGEDRIHSFIGETDAAAEEEDWRQILSFVAGAVAFHSDCRKK